MSAAAVLSRQNTGWPSPATPQDSRVARTDIKMKESPYISSLWVVSIPPRSRRNSNSAQHVLQKSVDFLTKLPIEIRIMILSYLSPTDLCRCQQVNSSWYHVIIQDNYLMGKCQHYLKRQKIHYIKNQENYPLTPHIPTRSSAGRRALSSLRNSGNRLSCSLPPLLPTQSSPMTDLLNFDRLQLRDDTTPGSHEHNIVKHDVRRCLFPEDNANITHHLIYTDSSIKDAPYNICGRESKRRIKRL